MSRITCMRATLVVCLALLAQAFACEHSNMYTGMEAVSPSNSPLVNWRTADMPAGARNLLLTCMSRFAPESVGGTVQATAVVHKALRVCRRVLPLMDQFGEGTSQTHVMQTLLTNGAALQGASFLLTHQDAMKTILQELKGVRRFQRAGAEAAASDILKYLAYKRFGVDVGVDLERMREHGVPLLRQLLVSATPLALNARQLAESAENFEELSLAMHTCVLGQEDQSLASVNRDECQVIQDALPVLAVAAGRAIGEALKNDRVAGNDALRILMIYQEAIALTKKTQPSANLTEYREDVIKLLEDVNKRYLQDAWRNYITMLNEGKKAAVATQAFVESHRRVLHHNELLDQEVAELLAEVGGALLSDTDAAEQRAFLENNQEKFLLRSAPEKKPEHVHTAVCPRCEIGEECTCPVDAAQHMVHLGRDLMATIEGKGPASKLGLVPGPRYTPDVHVPGDFRMTTFDPTAIHACVAASIESGVNVEALPLGWVGKCMAGTREMDVKVDAGSTTATPLHRRVHPDGEGFQLVVSSRTPKAGKKADSMNVVRIAFAGNTGVPLPKDAHCYGSYTRVCDYAARRTSARDLRKFVLKQALKSEVCRKHGKEPRGCDVRVFSPVVDGYVPLSDELLERAQEAGLISVRVVKQKEGMDALVVGTGGTQTLLMVEEGLRMTARKIPHIPACLDGRVIDIVLEANKMSAAEARRVWYDPSLHKETLEVGDSAESAKLVKRKLEKRCKEQLNEGKKEKKEKKEKAEANKGFFCRMSSMFC